MNNLDFLHHLAVVHWHLENLQHLPQFQGNEQLLLAYEQFKSAIEAEVNK
ncbi:MAG: hypothetical protein KME64_03910 [Scytonematopsis contorta HA4267-MV1]|nr:hypothetical protein [Scytonematopsis contorta HA4267-MV1]